LLENRIVKPEVLDLRRGHRPRAKLMRTMFRSINSAHRDEIGVTVTELLVVIVVITIIAGFALMQRGPANVQLMRQNVAQELKSEFERARFDSVKRRAADCVPQARVTLTPTSYTLRTYTMTDPCTAVANDQVTTLPSGIVIGMYDGTSLTSM